MKKRWSREKVMMGEKAEREMDEGDKGWIWMDLKCGEKGKVR